MAFLGHADTNISAIHGLIPDISKIFKSCSLLHYKKYYAFFAVSFQKLVTISIFVKILNHDL